MLSALFAAAVAAAPVVDAQPFADGIGVNVHVEYTDGGYADLARVASGLSYLHVSLVRDAAPNPANQGQGGYGALAREGVRFDLFVNGEPIGPAVERLGAFAREHPGRLRLVEGPNEVNNHASFTFEGEGDKHRAAVRYQTALREAVHASPDLKGVPVALYTDYPILGGPADVANFHSYPKTGSVEPQLGRDRSDARRMTPGGPIVDTETGFTTASAAHDGVSPLAQARLSLATLLDNAAHGVRETYLYQLFDAYPDAGGSDPERHYGLFDLGYHPKAAAEAVRRLTGVLTGPAPKRLGDVRFDAPKDVAMLRIRFPSGAEAVALWRTEPVWSPGDRRDVELAPARVAVSGRDSGALRAQDLIDGASAPAASEVLVGSDPIIVSAGRGGS